MFRTFDVEQSDTTNAVTLTRGVGARNHLRMKETGARVQSLSRSAALLRLAGWDFSLRDTSRFTIQETCWASEIVNELLSTLSGQFSQ